MSSPRQRRKVEEPHRVVAKRRERQEERIESDKFASLAFFLFFSHSFRFPFLDRSSRFIFLSLFFFFFQARCSPPSASAAAAPRSRPPTASTRSPSSRRRAPSEGTSSSSRRRRSTGSVRVFFQCFLAHFLVFFAGTSFGSNPNPTGIVERLTSSISPTKKKRNERWKEREKRRAEKSERALDHSLSLALTFSTRPLSQKIKNSLAAHRVPDALPRREPLLGAPHALRRARVRRG